MAIKWGNNKSVQCCRNVCGAESARCRHCWGYGMVIPTAVYLRWRSRGKGAVRNARVLFSSFKFDWGRKSDRNI